MSLIAKPENADQLIDVEEAARIRLQLSPYRALRRCSCTLDGEILRLQGQVPTYHYKQLAQVAMIGLGGIRSIINEIRVDETPRKITRIAPISGEIGYT